MVRAGIVGLPNVGKSTLFNAVTRTRKAQAANYPFCTIEPNVGVVTVPDSRLDWVATMSKSEKVVPASIELVDIAGLVKGASQGEGLGNQFLTHIREVDAIVQVVRCFEDPDIHHVAGSVDPLRDIETLNRNSITSPSCTTYSFPSTRSFPASRTFPIVPAAFRSANATVSAAINPRPTPARLTPPDTPSPPPRAGPPVPTRSARSPPPPC